MFIKGILDMYGDFSVAIQLHQFRAGDDSLWTFNLFSQVWLYVVGEEHNLER